MVGYMEPLAAEDVDPENPEKVVFTNEVFGNAIPPAFLPACEKGFREACNAGALINHPVEVRTGLWEAMCAMHSSGLRQTIALPFCRPARRASGKPAVLALSSTTQWRCAQASEKPCVPCIALDCDKLLLCLPAGLREGLRKVCNAGALLEN